MTFKITKYIYFHNNTDLPIMVDSFVDNSIFSVSIKVNPREKLILYSNVGEWHMHSMFESIEDRQIWGENGLGNCVIVGKFRSDPCASGNYSWLEDNRFECVYETLENKGVISLSSR